MARPRQMSRVGTARALVLLGSAVLLAASGVITFLALVFGPALLDRAGRTAPVVLAVVTFVVICLVAIVVATVISVRATSTRRVVLAGCGTLLVGSAAGAGAFLALITLW